MAISINLLPELGKDESKKKKFVRAVNLVTIGILIVTGVFTGGVFSFRAAAEMSYNNVTEEIEKQENIIKDNEEIEIKMNEVKKRVAEIDRILTARKNFINLVDNLESVTPRKIIFSDLTVNANDQIILTGTSPDYEELAGFVGALSGEWEKLGLSEQEILFGSVGLTSAARDEATNNVRFSLTMNALKTSYLPKGASDAE